MMSEELVEGPTITWKTASWYSPRLTCKSAGSVASRAAAIALTDFCVIKTCLTAGPLERPYRDYTYKNQAYPGLRPGLN